MASSVLRVAARGAPLHARGRKTLAEWNDRCEDGHADAVDAPIGIVTGTSGDEGDLGEPAAAVASEPRSRGGPLRIGLPDAEAPPPPTGERKAHLHRRGRPPPAQKGTSPPSREPRAPRP